MSANNLTVQCVAFYRWGKITVMGHYTHLSVMTQNDDDSEVSEFLVCCSLWIDLLNRGRIVDTAQVFAFILTSIDLFHSRHFDLPLQEKHRCNQ